MSAPGCPPPRHHPGRGAGNELLAILEEGEFVIRKEAAEPYMELLEAINAAPERGTASALIPSGGGVLAGAAGSIFQERGGVGDTYIFQIPNETRDEVITFIREEELPLHSKEQLRRSTIRP